jgi:beta-glucosidase
VIDDKQFLWGAASAGHQIEGNNLNSDIWLLEHLPVTVFKEPSFDACNSLLLWERDLDLAKEIGLTCYRFSFEWARIEPVEGRFSAAMLGHYHMIVRGCRERGLEPIVTLNHFANPVWFASKGGWTNPDAPALFERYCTMVANVMGNELKYVITFNEPNILRTLKVLGMPEHIWQRQTDMLELAAQVRQCEKFSGLNASLLEDFDLIQSLLIDGHRLARAALRSVNPDTQVGFSLAMLDDQPAHAFSLCEKKREENYSAWLQAADDADFVGVQNYERVVWDENGPIARPEGAETNAMGSWVDPTSLSNCVEYVHRVTGKPIMVTEHGIATEDDGQRASFIERTLTCLASTVEKGIPVLGYIHWTLLDNFEWVHGYDVYFGLCAVDRISFQRVPKESAYHYRSLILSYRG